MNSAHLVKLYTVYFLLTSVGLFAFVVALRLAFRIEPGGSLIIVTVIFPAMLVGHRYGKRRQARPEGGYAWRLSAVFATISNGAAVLTGLALFALNGAWAELVSVFKGSDGLFMWGLVAAAYLISWVLTRFFFGFGVKNQLRSMAEMAARQKDEANQP